MKVQRISIRKSRRESLFLIIAFLSAFLSVAVISAGPLYFDAIERLGMRRTLERFDPAQMGSWLRVDDVTFNSASIDATADAAASVGDHFGKVLKDRATFVRSGALSLSRVGDGFAPPGSVLVYQSIRGSMPAISLVNGTFPSDSEAGEIEVAILDSVATTYGINVGDVLRLIVHPTTIVHSTPRVSGIFRIDDPNDESWLGLSSTMFDPEQGPTGGRPAIIALTSGAGMERIANRGISDIGQVWSMFYVDVDELGGMKPGEFLDLVRRFHTESGKALPSSTSFNGIESGLVTLQRQLTFTNTTAVINGALFTAFAVFVLALNAGIVARQWLTEEVRLRVRGADRDQLFGAIAFYIAILFLLPAIGGPILASGLVPLLGLFGTFHDLTGGEPFPYRILAEQFIWSGVVAALLLALFVSPILLSRSGTLVRHLARLQPSQAPWFWRANLDIGIVIAAAAVIFELNGRGSLFVQRADGVTNLSLMASSLPVIAAVAASLVALRFFRLVGIGFERLARINFNPMIVLALKVFSRSTMRHAVLMMLAAGMMIVLVNASGLTATLGKNTQDQIDFATASDMRISGVESFKRSNNRVVEEINQLDWVIGSSWAARAEAATGSTDSASNFTMLSVRPSEFAGITTYRFDFADESMPELLQRIESFSPTGSLPLADDTDALQAAVKLERTGGGRIDIWARLRDGDGMTHTVRLTATDGDTPESDWRIVTSELRADLPRPMHLIAIEIYEPPTSPFGTAATLTIDSFHAVKRDGSTQLVSDFADSSVWHPMAASLADNADLAIVDEPIAGSADGRALRVAMGRGTDDGVRGIYYSEGSPIAVPLLVNRALLDGSGLHVGDGFNGSAYGRIVPFEIRGAFDIFPTTNEEAQPFAVANIDALLSYLEPVSEPFLANSAELYVSVDEDSHFEDRIAAIKAIEPSLRVADREALQVRSSTRLGDAAGWRVVGAIIAIAAVSVTVVTAIAIAIHNQHLTRLDSVLLEALGSSRIGLVMESATRIGLSIGIGYALGLVGGIYGVQFVADRMTRTSTGETALPPMVLQIDWLPVAFAALLVLIAALAPIVLAGIRPKSSVAVRIRTSSQP